MAAHGKARYPLRQRFGTDALKWLNYSLVDSTQYAHIDSHNHQYCHHNQNQNRWNIVYHWLWCNQRLNASFQEKKNCDSNRINDVYGYRWCIHHSDHAPNIRLQAYLHQLVLNNGTHYLIASHGVTYILVQSSHRNLVQYSNKSVVYTNNHHG